jgi:DNA-binding transcriptional ArsR family regulator
MTPDELLRSLLDSRGKAGICSPEKIPDPTRIRTLDALRKEELSVRELADRISVIVKQHIEPASRSKKPD